MATHPSHIQQPLSHDLAQWLTQLETLFIHLSENKTNAPLSEEAFEQWAQFQALDQRFQTWLQANLDQLQQLSASNTQVQSVLTDLNRLYHDLIAQCDQLRQACHQQRQQTQKQVSGAHAYQGVQKICGF